MTSVPGKLAGQSSGAAWAPGHWQARVAQGPYTCITKGLLMPCCWRPSLLFVEMQANGTGLLHVGSLGKIDR
jgi:hypothetical protein